ncbi:hypothetical protein D0X99_07055 [Algoriphagus lacus]|uniref:Uncharacterized protein n=1 Tax=Algoriphagus lacus TaxID=2056311 RepID=A0A418PV64_9BACT|nr:hypothetical protein D0X99_07055 [Algoriphagus lacus]
MVISLLVKREKMSTVDGRQLQNYLLLNTDFISKWISRATSDSSTNKKSEDADKLKFQTQQFQILVESTIGKVRWDDLAARVRLQSAVGA